MIPWYSFLPRGKERGVSWVCLSVLQCGPEHIYAHTAKIMCAICGPDHLRMWSEQSDLSVSLMLLECVHTWTQSWPLVIRSPRTHVNARYEQGLYVCLRQNTSFACETLPWGQLCVQSCTNLGFHFVLFSIVLSSYKCVCLSVCLFVWLLVCTCVYSDAKGLSNPSEVELLREKVYASLEAYCKQRYPEQQGR